MKVRHGAAYFCIPGLLALAWFSYSLRGHATTEVRYPGIGEDVDRGPTPLALGSIPAQLVPHVRAERPPWSAVVEEGRTPTASKNGATVTGRVLNQVDHGPVPGATLTLMLIGGDSLEVLESADAGGLFRFDHLHAGSYVLSARTEAGLEAFPVRLLLTGDQALRAPDLFVTEGARIRGRVREQDGSEPGTPFDLYIQPHPVDRSAPELRSGIWVARANDNGDFAVNDLFPIPRHGAALIAVGAGRIGSAPVPILDRGQDWVDVELRLPTESGFEVHVVDESGTAVPGASVRLAPQFAPFRGMVLVRPGSGAQDDALRACLWSITDHDGRADFRGLPVGDGYAYHAVAVTEGRPRFGPVRIDGPGQVRLELPTIPLPTRVKGKVRDVHGSAIAGARVRCSGTFEAEVTTAADGSYHLEIPETLRAGPHLLIGFAEGFCEARSVFRPDRDSAEGFDIRLRSGGALPGRLVDEQGSPVVGARVSAWIPSLMDPDIQQAISGSDGRFVLNCIQERTLRVRVESGFDLASGVFRPGVEAVLDVSAELVIVIPPSEARAQRVTLMPEGGSVDQVRIVDCRVSWRQDGGMGPRASPVPRIAVSPRDVLVSELHPDGWDVWLMDEAGGVGHLALERSDFPLSPIVTVPIRPLGSLTVRLDYPGIARPELQVKVGVQRTSDLQLPPSMGWIDEPVLGGRWVSSSCGSPLTISGLLPGDYEVFSLGGRAGVRVPVTVNGGGISEVSVPVDLGARLVLESSQEALLYLELHDGGVSSTHTVHIDASRGGVFVPVRTGQVSWVIRDGDWGVEPARRPLAEGTAHLEFGQVIRVLVQP